MRLRSYPEKRLAGRSGGIRTAISAFAFLEGFEVPNFPALGFCCFSVRFGEDSAMTRIKSGVAPRLPPGRKPQRAR